MNALSAREVKFRSMLRRLTHVAACINAVQHAGNPVTPEMWAELYAITNEAKALLQKEDRQ